MRRVTRGRVVVMTYDPSFRGFWLADCILDLVDLPGRAWARRYPDLLNLDERDCCYRLVATK